MAAVVLASPQVQMSLQKRGIYDFWNAGSSFCPRYLGMSHVARQESSRIWRDELSIGMGAKAGDLQAQAVGVHLRYGELLPNDAAIPKQALHLQNNKSEHLTLLPELKAWPEYCEEEVFHRQHDGKSPGRVWPWSQCQNPWGESQQASLSQSRPPDSPHDLSRNHPYVSTLT